MAKEKTEAKKETLFKVKFLRGYQSETKWHKENTFDEIPLSEAKTLLEKGIAERADDLPNE